MERYRVGVVGCAGRMGRMLLSVLAATEGCEIVGGTEAPDSPAVGADLGAQAGLGELGIAVGADPVALFAKAEAVIDFTTPAASVSHAGLAAQAEAVHVIGTTGLDADESAAIARAARHT
ncbi:MAG: 4-hydroxy-tetrahydrodipicolinate reductase, partial [Proteobacteria bacterium]|nr:4-hydroxy-tetrahydrodipicolinate reductase [Pseudomonadota bacterium]